MKSKRKISSRRRGGRRRRRFLKRMAFAVLTVGLFCFAGNQIFHSTFAEQMFSAMGISGSGAVNAGLSIDLKSLYSPEAVLIDAASGEVLGERGGSKQIYPASLTKIMTAILAVENTSNLDETVIMPEGIFGELYAQNASMAGFLPGESAVLRDVLYGVLLPSGAECCLAFAERISGSEKDFADLMNQKAEDLGMKNTHFVNSTGLHDSQHYSTVRDMAVLLRYALQNPEFRAAFTSAVYSTSPSEMHPEGFTFHSTMFRYMETAQVSGGEILGGKTGYTGEAGQCLASLAQVNGREYILVTAGAQGNHETEQFHITDARNVYNQVGECTRQ